MVGGWIVGAKNEGDTKWEREKKRTANDKVSSFSMLRICLYGVCISVYAPVYKMLSSYFVRSFYFHFGCLSCMSFYRNFPPFTSRHSTRMLVQIISSSYICWTECTLSTPLQFCRLLNSIRWCCCRIYLLDSMDICMGLCHCDCNVMKTHFDHLLHCLFHYIEHIIQNENKDRNGGTSERQLHSKNKKTKQKKHTMQRVNTHKEKVIQALPKQAHCYHLTNMITRMKNRNVAWIRHDSTIICSTMHFYTILYADITRFFFSAGAFLSLSLLYV